MAKCPICHEESTQKFYKCPKCGLSVCGHCFLAPLTGLPIKPEDFLCRNCMRSFKEEMEKPLRGTITINYHTVGDREEILDFLRKHAFCWTEMERK